MLEAHSHSSAAHRQDSQNDAGADTANPLAESQHAGQRHDEVAEEVLTMGGTMPVVQTRMNVSQLSQNAEGCS